jgi:hypothetical protein
MSIDSEMTRKGKADAEAVRELLDSVLGPMPIYATRIGYRTNSTPDERRLGMFLFRIAREWDDFKAGVDDV